LFQLRLVELRGREFGLLLPLLLGLWPWSLLYISGDYLVIAGELRFARVKLLYLIAYLLWNVRKSEVFEPLGLLLLLFLLLFSDFSLLPHLVLVNIDDVEGEVLSLCNFLPLQPLLLVKVTWTQVFHPHKCLSQLGLVKQLLVNLVVLHPLK